MKSRALGFVMTLLALFCFACNENARGPEQSGAQVVSPSLNRQDPDINAFIELDESPKLLKRVQAKYPEAAMKAGIVGTVYVKALLTPEGRVKRAVVVERKGGTSELEQAAIEAAQQWLFSSPRAKGQPTSVWVVIPFKFSIAK